MNPIQSAYIIYFSKSKPNPNFYFLHSIINLHGFIRFDKLFECHDNDFKQVEIYAKTY